MTNQQTQPFLPAFAPPDPLPERPQTLGSTKVSYANAKTILNKATGFIGSFDYTLNPYSGCSYACTYCYAASFTPTTELRDDWGNWVSVKQNAEKLLAGRAPGSLDDTTIYMSSVTDPYQPIDRKVKLTRAMLENLAENHSPKLVIQTRGPHVTRDIDIFRKIEERGGRVQVNMTITTDDEDVRRAFEPGCPSNRARARAITEVAEAGLRTAITMTPLLMVSDPTTFARSMLATGASHFVLQSFNLNQPNQFIAHTRDKAMGVLAEKLACDPRDVLALYIERYERTREEIRRVIPLIAEGREGFRPPF
ncbi:MAG: radical SAM protein [Dehalococcoidia bacterium]|nr:radical SAM protein [Dehalococcoidia bacterium]